VREDGVARGHRTKTAELRSAGQVGHLPYVARSGFRSALLIPGVRTNEAPIGWSSDGHTLFVFGYGELPAQVVEINISTGREKRGRNSIRLMPLESTPLAAS
jgi:hypothetical protein